jgi:hypothetical protein
LKKDEDPRARRSSPRVVGPFTARWVGTVKVPLIVHDLSTGGCFILSGKTVLPGDRITLEIDLPDKTTITVQAEPLQSQRSKGFGVRFINVPALDLLRLQRNILALTGG